MADGMGRLIGIWVKRAHGGPMEPVDQATLVEGWGMEGNALQLGKRQVTLIERESWDEMMSLLQTDADPSTRRANLMVVGIRLADTRGRILNVGSCRLQVWGETRPCRQMDAAVPGLKVVMAQNWRGGVFAEVLQGGQIALDEPVYWEERQDQASVNPTPSAS